MAVTLREVISPLSLFSIKIRQICQGKEYGGGTGFIVREVNDGPPFLITNWHVLTGRNPQNPENLLDPVMPSSPDAFRVELFEANTDLERKLTVRIPLYAAASGQPRWLEHPKFGNLVDIGALELQGPLERAEIVSSAELHSQRNMKLEVGMDVCVVGFPYGLTVGGILPLWKKGIVASEPWVQIDDLPRFLIDASTRKGMSGSPVFAISNGTYRTTDGKVVQDFGLHPTYNFIGIYSAYLPSPGKEPLPELGVVWHERAIGEIFESPLAGTNPYLPPIG